MVTCTRRIQFCAGHRVQDHESKCRNLHGHNYVAFFEAMGVDQPLDGLGRVIDFSVLKEKMGGYINAHWDHGFIFGRDDKEALNAMTEIHGQKTYVLPYNPTAENMARYLLDISRRLLEGTGVKLTRVTLWETENCYAEVTA